MPAPSRSLKRWKPIGWLVGIGIILCGLIYLARDELRSTARAYYLGRAMVASEEFGRNLPRIEEIEILALGGPGTEGSPDTFYGDLGFRVGTVNRFTITGADAERILDVWRLLPVGHQFGGFCHQPYYALRFRAGGRTIFQTTICWKCSNYALPLGLLGVTEYGFDAKSAQGLELLRLLTEYAPHPPT